MKGYWEDILNRYEDCSESINGIIFSWSEDSVYMNYDNLIDWSRDNIDYIEESVSELGFPEPFDFIVLIQQGQACSIRKELYESMEESISDWIDEKIEEMCNEEEIGLEYESFAEVKSSEIYDLKSSIDINSSFKDITDGIDKLFEETEGIERWNN